MEKVFLSYARQDNDVPEEWVTNFYKDLNRYARVYSGKHQLEVWKDDISREKRSESIEEEIKKGLKDSEMLIALVSPSYVQSWWGAFEREYFRRFVLSEKQNRILNVIKLKISPDEVKTLSRDLKVNFAYNFCKDIDGVPITIMNGDPDYEKTLIALATSIANKLKEKPTTTALKVFVANTTEDLLLDINRMIAELESLKGVKIDVVTVGNFGESEEEQREQILDVIGECALSIHLLGHGAGYRAASFQWETIIDHLHKQSVNIKVITWISSALIKNMNGADNSYSDFLKERVMKLDTPFHDFIINSFEDFLINVKEKLKV
ncbi:MAG: hypothetical protein C0490_19830 [Marivirga sp.]|nr:hypothetical protein [Marivirga sp.]